MIVGSASSIYTPVSVSLDERDALRRHLLHTEGIWSRRSWDLATRGAKWADACRLMLTSIPMRTPAAHGS
jgi:hypothetical protein